MRKAFLNNVFTNVNSKTWCIKSDISITEKKCIATFAKNPVVDISKNCHQAVDLVEFY